jgi:hypothetical protein
MTRIEKVNSLVASGYREKLVKDWSDDRIETVLASRKRDEQLSRRRGEHAANVAEGNCTGVAPQMIRETAARYLAEVLEGGSGDDIVQAVLYTGHALSSAEAKQFAKQLIKTLRYEPDTAQ